MSQRSPFFLAFFICLVFFFSFLYISVADIANCANPIVRYNPYDCNCTNQTCAMCASSCGAGYHANTTASCGGSCNTRICCKQCLSPYNACRDCEIGYLLSADELNCTDIDECLEGACPQHSDCTNLVGSFECSLCYPGYWQDNFVCSPCDCVHNSTYCDQLSGECFCEPGWNGTRCDETICGDGIRSGGEECDDGNQADGDCCSSTCTNEPAGSPCSQSQGDGNNCTQDTCDGSGLCSVFTPGLCHCGNGVVEPGNAEACDTGPLFNQQCSYGQVQCQVCNSSCLFGAGQTSFCGDGVLNAPNNEACDDGNFSPNDGCSSLCQIELGYICPVPGALCQAIPASTNTSIQFMTPSSTTIGLSFQGNFTGVFPSPRTLIGFTLSSNPCTNASVINSSPIPTSNSLPMTFSAINQFGTYSVCYSTTSGTIWSPQSLVSLDVPPATPLATDLSAIAPSSVNRVNASSLFSITFSGGIHSKWSQIVLVDASQDPTCHDPLSLDQGRFAVSNFTGSLLTFDLSLAVVGTYKVCYSTDKGQNFKAQSAVSFQIFPAPTTATPTATTTTSTTTSTTSTTSTTTPTNTPTMKPTTSPTPPPTSSILSPLQMAGVIIGGVAGILLILAGAVLLVIWKRRTSLDKEDRPQHSHSMSTLKLEHALEYLSDGEKSVGTAKTTKLPPTGYTTLLNTEVELSIPGFLEIDYSHFALHHKLGKGGAAVLYEGVILDEKTKKRCKDGSGKVAIKVINAEMMTQRTNSREEFHQEIMVMNSLRHPNIISLIGYVENPPCIITELYDTDLHRLIYHEAELITDTIVLSLTQDVAKAMLVIHNMGVIHRDLKSPNILIKYGQNRGELTAVVCDFGIAKVAKAPKLVNQKFHHVAGLSPRYTAPEVFARFRASDFNAPPHLERKADVFSFAMIVWELLSLSPPWGEQPSQEIEELVRSNQRPPPPDARGSPIRSLLRDLSIKAWNGTPALRPDFEEITLLLRPLGDLYLTV